MPMNRRGFLKLSTASAAAAIAGLRNGHDAHIQALANGLQVRADIPQPHGLQVSGNHRFLCDKQTGKPFFLLTDTAWNINALTYKDIDLYLRDRSAHKFSAFMFTLNFYPQAQAANVYGQRAYIGPGRTDLNPQYFEYCDYIIRTAAKYRLYAMVFAMWGGKQAGTMNTYTASQLHTIGLKVGARLKSHDNVILVAGGESSPPHIATRYVNAIGSGLKAGCEGKHLVSVHPCGNRSCSEYFARSAWLDFYMIQGSSSRHGRYYDMTKLVTHDYNLQMIKPTMIAENYYESGTTQPAIRQRRGLYLSVFAGAFGCAYGHDALWQMSPHTAQKWMLNGWPPGVPNWKDALNTRAVEQLHYIRTLLYSRPYFSRIPDQSLIISGQGKNIANRIQACRDGTEGHDNATYIMAYLAAPAAVTLKTSAIAADRLNAWRFNPATGKSIAMKMNFPNPGQYSFPKQSHGHDEVVVLDDADRHYPSPSLESDQ
jgi:hypothetical protein